MFFIFIDLVPAATRGNDSPAPGLEGSLAPSPAIGNRGLTPTNPVHDPRSPNPVPVRLRESQSPVQRVVPEQSPTGILVAAQRRCLGTRNPEAVPLHLSRMEKRSVPLNLPPALHRRKKTIAGLNQGRSVQHLAQCPARGLARGPDPPLRISGRAERCFLILELGCFCCT